MGSRTELRNRVFAWTGFVSAWVAIVCAIAVFNPNYRWTDTPRDTPYGGDFLQEWAAADLLVHGNASQLYDLNTFNTWQHDPDRIGFVWNQDSYYPPVYPPVYYWLLGPLSSIDYRYATWVWFGLLTGAMLIAILVSERSISQVATSQSDFIKPELDRTGQALSGRAPRTWIIAFWIATLICPAILSSWVLGQKGTLWLLVVAVAWAFWVKDRRVLAGFMTAFLTVKPTLFVCLPLFMLWKRQGWFLLGLSLGTASLWLTAACQLPPRLWYDYLKFVAESGTYQLNSGYQATWSCSLVTLFEYSQLAWFPTLKTVLWLILAGFVLGSLREIRRDQLQSPEALFRLMLATALLSPHWYYYDLAWLVLPLRLMLPTSPRRVAGYFVVLCVGILVAKSITDIVHFPVLTIVTFGVLMHSRVCSRRTRRASSFEQDLVERAARLTNKAVSPTASAL